MVWGLGASNLRLPDFKPSSLLRPLLTSDNVAVPIVDRIIHHSHIFMLGGESYRLKAKLNNSY
ncbi:ATP-binding protein [Methylobacter sp.]|uniref:ATP-binding protein n=1 Tax=Methylobacter sp. TaxID=2051955 RepID=UPI00338D789F